LRRLTTRSMPGMMIMDRWDFLKWRKTLRLTQPEAGEVLGVTRSTISNWEGGKSSLPKAVELACTELARQQKQRPDFGPVGLLYADCPIWDEAQTPEAIFHCERHLTNTSAIERARRLRRESALSSPIVVDQSGDLIWSTSELLRECDRQRDAVKESTKTL
jgi:DNA-binding XRE family transcriptional regulator